MRGAACARRARRVEPNFVPREARFAGEVSLARDYAGDESLLVLRRGVNAALARFAERGVRAAPSWLRDEAASRVDLV